MWQTTDSARGSTPGHRNYGAAPDLDWAIEGIQVDPALPKSGESAQLSVVISNEGLIASSGSLTVVHLPSDTLLVHEYSGLPGERVQAYTNVTPRGGLNVISVALSADDRASNNFAQWSFYADGTPVLFSEFCPAPVLPQPEWLELFFPHGFDPGMEALSVADLSDTAQLPAEVALGNVSTFAVLTEDTTLFALAYPDVSAPVIELAGWPTLNNDGDTLLLLLNGAVVDRAAFPSAGNRRGVAWERVGQSDQWGWSVAPGGSTPGRVNSLDVHYSAGIEVDVSPNPFAAGLGETVQFKYHVPFGAEGELRLYRGDGRPVRTLFERRPVVSGEISWDGSGDTGGLVPVGIYIVKLRLYKPHELVHLSTVAVAR